MQKLFFFLLAASAALPLAGCGEKSVPCPICFEDAWSREPFPGQAKQHIPTVDMRTEAQKQNPAEPLPVQ